MAMFLDTNVGTSQNSPYRQKLSNLTQQNKARIQQEAQEFRGDVSSLGTGAMSAMAKHYAQQGGGEAVADTMASPFTGDVVSSGNPFGNTAESIFSGTTQEVGNQAMAQGGEAAGAAAAGEAASEAGSGAAGAAVGAGLAGSGARMVGKYGLAAAGVDPKTAAIASEAAGLGAATLAGGPIGAATYTGGRLLTSGIF